MTYDPGFHKINEAKVNFDHIYDRKDPRAYFRELKRLGYAIPSTAKPIFKKRISCRREHQDETIQLLDLGCSYGVNAAVLKYDLSMIELYEHWAQEKLVDASPEEVVDHARHYFADLEEPANIEVIGLDVAENAVIYAEESGLLNGGLAVNLETEPLRESAAEELADVDMVTSTGCVGYVTEKSFNHLLPAVMKGQPAWLANFVLRMFPFDTIEETLSDHGYITEKLEGQTFIQRQFSSAAEQQQVVEQLHQKGIDTTGKEMDGHLLAEFYLSRPANEVAELPIEHMFSV